MAKDNETKKTSTNDMQKAIDNALSEDKSDKQTSKIKSLLTEKECFMQDCEVKHNLKKAKNELKDSNSNLSDARNKIEELEKALKAKASDEERQNALIKVYSDPVLKEQEIEKSELNAQISKYEDYMAEQRSKIDELQGKLDDFLKTLDTDKKFKDRFIQMNNVEERVAFLSAREIKLKESLGKSEIKQKELDIKLLKATQMYNEKIGELSALEDKIQTVKMILKKGAVLKIEPEVQKKPFLKRIFKLTPTT